MILGVVGAGHDGRRHRPARLRRRLSHAAARPAAGGARRRRAARPRRPWSAGPPRAASAPDAAGLLEPARSLEDLADCDLVIEAAPERPDLKRELFAELSAACRDDVVLATNTSSIPVTSLAGAAARPENVVGMHFFNPPPLMELLEVIRADQTGDRALELARTTGEAMGKRVILAADGPGFLVNRCGRPFSGEGLRVLGERVATRGADRPHLPDGRRLSDGAVRADGPGRRRRRLRGGQVVRRAVLRRAALAAQPDPGAHGRRRPARPQERARLLRVRRRRLLPARRPRAAGAGRRRRHARLDRRRRAGGRRTARARQGGRLRAARGRPGGAGRRRGHDARRPRPRRRAAAGPVRGEQPRRPRRARGGRLRPAGAARLAGRADARTGARRASPPRRRSRSSAGSASTRNGSRTPPAWCSRGSSASS